MTNEEVIEREQYSAEANREMADTYHTDENIYLKEEEAFRNREDYHRQLAEWLKELKAYKEELPKEIKNAKVRQAEALEANVKNENYNSHLAEYIKGYLCGLSYTEGIIAKILEDVKVVEDGSDTK